MTMVLSRSPAVSRPSRRPTKISIYPPSPEGFALNFPGPINWSSGTLPVISCTGSSDSRRGMAGPVTFDEINQPVEDSALHQLAITNHTRVPVASGYRLRIREIVFTFKLSSKSRTFGHILQSQRADALLVKANILGIDGAAYCHWITHNRRPVTMLTQDSWKCKVLTHPVPACALRAIEA